MEHITLGGAVLLLFLLGPVFYFIRLAKRGKEIFIRRIPGIDAIEEGVGRAVELGRPLSFTTGTAGVGPLLYSCLEVLRHIAKKTARFGSKLYVPCQDPEVMALTDASLQAAYREAKRSGSYDPSSVRFLSDEQFAYASGYMGLMHREQVGTAFLFGSFAAESLILAEAGQQAGALQVAGTTSNEQIPFFITACDYTLIGEEVYAAGAYLSKDPVQCGSLRGQDIAKLFLMVIILLGVAISSYSMVTSGKPSNFIETLIKPQKDR